MGKYDTYVAAWRTRLNKENRELEDRRVRAFGKAKECAEVLKKEFGAKRVILYGSALHPNLILGTPYLSTGHLTYFRIKYGVPRIHIR